MTALLVEYILVYIYVSCVRSHIISINSIGTTHCDHIIVATHVLGGIQIVLLLVALRIVIALVALYTTIM